MGQSASRISKRNQTEDETEIMGLRKLIQQTFAIDVTDDILLFIFSYIFNAQIEISFIDAKYADDHKINIYDQNNEKLQTIDFTSFEPKRKTLSTILYSKENGHIWVIFYKNDSNSMTLYHSYLMYDPLKMGQFCIALPLTQTITKSSIAYSEFQCTSNGDLFYIDNGEICLMNIFSKAFKFKRYKTKKSKAFKYSKPVCYTGSELNKLFGNKFEETVYYLCYFQMTKDLGFMIYIYELHSGKLMYEAIKKINNKQIKDNEISGVGYEFDCDSARIVVIGSGTNVWYSYDLYAFHIYLENDGNEEVLINDLKKIGTTYAEGGFYVDCILPSINDTYYVWFKMNGRGIGYNHTKCIEISKSDLTVKDSQEEYCYKYPVDKKMMITL